MSEETTNATRRGQAGGRAILEQRGVEHLRAIGSTGGKQTVARHGREHMQAIGRKGFAVTVARHFGGDRERAINVLIHRGLMAIDPFPQNGAWTREDVPHRYTAPNEAKKGGS